MLRGMLLDVVWCCQVLSEAVAMDGRQLDIKVCGAVWCCVLLCVCCVVSRCEAPVRATCGSEKGGRGGGVRVRCVLALERL